MTNLTLLDVCAGIGSFSLGAHRNGIRTVAQIELEDNRREVLAKHFPDAIRLGDIYDVTAKDVPGQINIMAGGTPCQDLSVAGKRAGLDGSKSSVYYEFSRLAHELKPEWVVWENVPGALSSNGGKDFAVVIGGLTGIIPEVPDGGWKNAGFARGHYYNVAYRILDAKYSGVPQRRRRIFLVASLGSGRCAKVLFEPESVPGSSSTHPKAWKTDTRIAPTLTKSASGFSRTGDERGTGLDSYISRKIRSDEFTPDDISSTLTKRDAKDFGDLVANSIDVRNLNLNGDISGTLQAKKSGGWSLNYQNPVMAFIGQGGASAHTMGESSENAPTIIKGQVNNVMHNRIVRRLTPTECERLQGFPDSWTAGHSDTQRYQMLGDSIAVPNSEWIMKRIKEVNES